MSGHFSRYLSDGSAILSGHEVILQRTGALVVPVRELGAPLVGSNPCPFGPFGGRFFAFNPGNKRGPRVFDRDNGLSTEIYPLELAELAAAGNVVAGVSGAEGCLVIIRVGENVPVIRIPGAGQPSVASDGHVIYRTGDDRVWPMACRTAEAFDTGAGRIMARRRGETAWRDVTVGAREHRPFLFDVDGVPWVFPMTDSGLRIRPLFPEDGSEFGYPVPAELSGENRNIQAHCVVVGRTVRAVWQNNKGTEQLLYDFDLNIKPVRLVDIVAPPPPPQPPDPKPEPEPMDIAKYLAPRKDVVEAVKRDYPHLKGGAIVDQVAHRLNREHQTDVFGRKARHADGSDPNLDALTIRLDDHDFSKKKLIDVLLGAKEGRDEPTWDVRPEHEEANNGFWRRPVAADLDGGQDGDGGDEDPNPITHAYEGGDNDTGECDVILAGGKCNQPPDAPIHKVAQPPVPPVTPPTKPPVTPNVDTLALILIELRKLNAHLGVRA